MSDHDVPTLRFTTAALMQRLLGPMQRVLRVACDDLGMTPVVGLGGAGDSTEAMEGRTSESRSMELAVGSRLDAGVPGPRSAESEASVAARGAAAAGASALASPADFLVAASEGRVAPSGRPAAPIEPLTAPAGLLTSTTNVLATPPRSLAGAAERGTTATRPVEEHAATSAAGALPGRIRLRPRPPTDAVASRRSPASGSVVPTTPPSPARSSNETIRLRALPPREHAAATTAAPPRVVDPRDHIVPTAAAPATPASPEPEPLVRTNASLPRQAPARVLVPVVDAPLDRDRDEDREQADASRGAARQGPALLPARRGSDFPPSSASALTLREHLPPAVSSSSSLALASPPPPPHAAPTHAPAPRVVSLEALGPSTAFGPSSALSEHALAAVIAAAARRHGIDT